MPHGVSLLIETDNSNAAKQLNDALLTRKRGEDIRTEVEKEDCAYDHNSWCEDRITPVVNRIEVRTLRGDSFVDIIDSSQDTSAARGLAAARE